MKNPSTKGSSPSLISFSSLSELSSNSALKIGSEINQRRWKQSSAFFKLLSWRAKYFDTKRRVLWLDSIKLQEKSSAWIIFQRDLQLFALSIIFNGSNIWFSPSYFKLWFHEIFVHLQRMNVNFYTMSKSGICINAR